MARENYDRAAADWEKVTDAVRYAGGGGVTVPALDLALIFHGYNQLKSEREEALQVLGVWHRQGLVDTFAVLDMQRALGVISQEQYDEQVRAIGVTNDTAQVNRSHVINAVALVDEWQRRGVVLPDDAAEMYKALGEVTG